MRIFLVRHGLTDWNVSRLMQGQQDVPLNGLGFQQSELLVQHLSKQPIQRIFSSDLKRCKVTAEVLAIKTGAKLIVTENLRERHNGIWEGKPTQEAYLSVAKIKAASHISDYDIAPEGGESVREVWQRTHPICNALIPNQGNVAIVSHGGTMCVLLSKILELPIEACSCFHFKNGSITELERRPDGRFMLIKYSDDSHLAPLNNHLQPSLANA